MGLPDYARVLRRRWAWLLTSVVVILGASVVWAVDSPPRYSSTETLFYTGAAQDAATETRLNSYASLATSVRVVDAIRTELGLTESTTTVTRRISAQAEPNTLIVTVTATDPSPEGARRLASAAARQLVLLSTSLETPSTSTGQTATGQQSSGQSTGGLVAADTATPAVAEGTAQRIVGLGVVLGLLAGIVLALVREATDSRIRSPGQLFQLGVPAQRVVEIVDAAVDTPTGQVAEGYRVLRTVLFRGGHQQPTTIVVSSCDRDHPAGVAPALAVTFARTAIRVVLVSTDLRSAEAGPEWARAEPGLGNVLAGETTLPEALEAARQRELWLLSAGRRLPFPEDSLASIAMSQVVETLRTDFDLVIMDALPLTVYADAVSLAEATQAGVLLTVVEAKTRRDNVRAALDTLESLGIPLVAVALVRPPRKRLGPRRSRGTSRTLARLSVTRGTDGASGASAKSSPSPDDLETPTDDTVSDTGTRSLVDGAQDGDGRAGVGRDHRTQLDSLVVVEPLVVDARPDDERPVDEEGVDEEGVDDEPPGPAPEPDEPAPSSGQTSPPRRVFSSATDGPPPRR